jgi:hypothetical protein
MIYPLYLAIKTELAKETFLKNISWYNNQYEAGLVIDTCAFIEFYEDMLIDVNTKDSTVMDTPIRIHFAKKIVANTDGTIPDSDILTFDGQADSIVTRLKGFWPQTGGANITLRPLKLVKFASFQKQNGWQVFYIDLTTRLIF